MCCFFKGLCKSSNMDELIGLCLPIPLYIVYLTDFNNNNNNKMSYLVKELVKCIK